MAAEFPGITESNHDEIQCYLDHILTDLHDALKMLRDQGVVQARHDRMLEEFRPLLNQFRSPLAAAVTARRRRNNG